MSEQRTYTLSEVSECLHIGKTTLRSYVSKGILPVTGVGSYRQMLFSDDDIKSMLIQVRDNEQYQDGIECFSIEEKYLTSKEVAGYIGVSQSTVISYCNKGILKPGFIAPSGTKRFSSSNISDFIKSLQPVDGGAE